MHGLCWVCSFYAQPNEYKMSKFTKAVAAIMLMVFFVVSCTKPETPNNGGNNNPNDSVVDNNDSIIDNSGSLNGHDYVDLGLPSGTLWASCNVGANSPEEFGDYFAWGETMHKGIYDWKSYRYGGFVHDRYELSKYCTDSDYGLGGFVDGIAILEPADDAARIRWGEEWRTPTIAEWEELFLNTTGMWITLNGVKGWHITASNGNELFLPAAGYWWDDVFNADLGLYWSVSLNVEFPYRAWGFHFNCDSSHLCGSSDRNRGQTVRAVCSAK